MKHKPDEETLRNCFAEQMDNCSVLKDDVTLYNILPLIDPSRTYFRLLSFLNKHIRSYNVKELVMQMKGTVKNPQMKLLHTTRYHSSHVYAPFRRDCGRG